jgi:integrase
VVRDAGRGSERGLEIRVSAGGVKTWSMRYYRPSDGKRVRLQLGTYPAMSLETARKECRAARVALDKRDDPSIAREQRKGADTFEALAQEYLRLYAGKKKSREETRRILEREWFPVIGSMKAGEAKRLTIAKRLEHIAFERNAPVAANRALAAVRGVYRWALKTGRLETVPVIGLPRVGEERPRSRSLSEDEIRTLWNALPALAMDDDIKDVIRLCLLLGQRVGEVTGMTTSEIDIKTRTWLLPGERTKNSLSHSVPLSVAALEILEPRLKRGRAFVFPGRNSQKVSMVADAPNRARARNQDAIGVPPFTVHDLRRTVNTHMARLGVESQLRSRIMNHVAARKASITEGVYNAHSYDDEKRVALDRWAAELIRIVGEEPINRRSETNIVALPRVRT